MVLTPLTRVGWLTARLWILGLVEPEDPRGDLRRRTTTVVEVAAALENSPGSSSERGLGAGEATKLWAAPGVGSPASLPPLLAASAPKVAVEGAEEDSSCGDGGGAADEGDEGNAIAPRGYHRPYQAIRLITYERVTDLD